jgi:hypothetical protein
MKEATTSTSMKIQACKIDGKEYFTIGQFASIINRSHQCVYALVSKGNSLRRLKVVRFLGKPLIPVSELTEFPFTGAGRRPLGDIYHYTLSGEQVNCEQCSFQQKDTHTRS